MSLKHYLFFLHSIKTFKEKVNLLMKYFDLIYMGCTTTMHFILYLQRFLSNNEISRQRMCFLYIENFLIFFLLAAVKFCIS